MTSKKSFSHIFIIVLLASVFSCKNEGYNQKQEQQNNHSCIEDSTSYRSVVNEDSSILKDAFHDLQHIDTLTTKTKYGRFEVGKGINDIKFCRNEYYYPDSSQAIYKTVVVRSNCNWFQHKKIVSFYNNTLAHESIMFFNDTNLISSYVRIRYEENDSLIVADDFLCTTENRMIQNNLRTIKSQAIEMKAVCTEKSNYFD